ncbi:hypothetical protein [Bacillus paralicheniformis]|uniref:hypothetical protein n=1 Tax=Bacillus paralicheniformis TaxID=1648923 RepID=UPI003D1C3802
MAKTKKYVRILKAKYASSWYADKIGEVFEVEREANLYTVRRGDESLTAIRKEDAELIVTEKRPAKVGERVMITDKYGTSGEYKDGDILTADLCIGHAITAKEVDLTIIFHSEYEVIVNNEVKNEEDNELGKTYAFKPNLDAMGYDELIEHGEAVMRAISLRSYSEGYKQGKFDAVMDATHSPEKEELPYEFSDEAIELAIKEARRYLAQERRDEIVEQAKADVERLTARWLDRSQDGGFLGSYTYRAKYYVVKFNVNRNKRAVTAIVRSSDYTGKGMGDAEIGIAKAAPDDCFNEHIGKAIALHRALGLEVPDEYLNAPQPTEVRVGDVVRSTVDISKEYVISQGENAWNGRGAGLSSMVAKYGKIIDDSRTEVGE